MESFFETVAWTPVLVSAVLAFLVGWAWYSPVLFVKPWLAGLPTPAKWQVPMWMPMAAQLGATLALAVVVQSLYQAGAYVLIFLVAITLMGFVKANGMYSGKTKAAISVEVLYLAVMVGVLVVVNMWLG